MKLCRSVLLCAIAGLTLLTVLPVSAAQRCVFLEDFTNASCPPCASLNPGLRAMLHDMTEDTVISIAWHVWWPGGDPMYNYNTGEVQTRANYYGVPNRGVPEVHVDGSWYLTGYTPTAVATIRNQVRSRYSATSPCTIDFVALASGETAVTVVGTVHAEEDMLSPNMRLFVALITDTLQYQSPPGSNGETLFPHVFRDVWPGATGQSFTLSAGQDYAINATVNRDASWNVEDLSVLVWAQDYSTQVVQQAAESRVSRNYGLIANCTDPRQRIVDPAAGDATYFIDITNIGNMDDIFNVDIQGAFPAGWTHSVSAIDIPPDPNHIEVPVTGNGGQQTLVVVANPNGYPGTIDFDVQIVSQHEPLVNATETFRLMAGIDLLLVDDSQGSTYNSFYANALSAIGLNFVWGQWDNSQTVLNASELSGVDMVVWFTGDQFSDQQTISAAEQVLLSNYLDQGGHLMVTGQGIGFDLRNPADTVFFRDHLHTHYLVNYTSGHTILGIPGDPISDGLDTVAIAGGDGANNQIRQSSLEPADEFAVPTFHWVTPPSQGGDPALRIQTATYRAIYLGFGFEAVNNASARATLMGHAVNWLMESTSADNPREPIPSEFSLAQNYPNPFNPETTIPFVLPERARVTLQVFDLLGRVVASMNQGMQEAGAHAINWNASALSSGIYFYRLDAAGGANRWSATRKLMLLK